MNYLKTTLLLLFGLYAVLCVSYAHSETPTAAAPGGFYETDNILLPNCSLMVDFEGASAKFKVPGFSNLTFPGFWPKAPADVYLSAVRGDNYGLPVVEPGHGTTGISADEVLVIRFALVNGGLHPVSYVYENIALSQKTKGYTKSRSCSGLKKIR